MRENQSLTDLIGWGLMASIIAGLILLATSCTVPRVGVPIKCDHQYVYTATPAKDSTIAYPKASAWTTTEYRIPPDSINVVANQQCICLFCHDIKKCF